MSLNDYGDPLTFGEGFYLTIEVISSRRLHDDDGLVINFVQIFMISHGASSWL